MPLSLATAMAAAVLAHDEGPNLTEAGSLTIRLNDPCPPSRMSGGTDWRVVLGVDVGERRVSTLINITRGLALDVRTLDGKLVAPAEPPPSSSPLPPSSPADPHANDALVRPGAPAVLRVGEATRWIFPGPGQYRVRVAYTFSNPQVWSPPIVCEVR